MGIVGTTNGSTRPERCSAGRVDQAAYHAAHGRRRCPVSAATPPLPSRDDTGTTPAPPAARSSPPPAGKPAAAAPAARPPTGAATSTPSLRSACPRHTPPGMDRLRVPRLRTAPARRTTLPRLRHLRPPHRLRRRLSPLDGRRPHRPLDPQMIRPHPRVAVTTTPRLRYNHLPGDDLPPDNPASIKPGMIHAATVARRSPLSLFVVTAANVDLPTLWFRRSACSSRLPAVGEPANVRSRRS